MTNFYVICYRITLKKSCENSYLKCSNNKTEPMHTMLLEFDLNFGTNYTTHSEIMQK